MIVGIYGYLCKIFLTCSRDFLIYGTFSPLSGKRLNRYGKYSGKGDKWNAFSISGHLDFGLYLISGILLIFILEQFVQLGMVMKEKRVNEKLYVF